MVVATAPMADGYYYRLEVNQNSQNIGGNSSSVGYHLSIMKGSGSGKHAGGPHYWSLTINGNYREGSVGSYDFTQYSQLVIATGSYTIPHNADGTKTISGQAGWDDNNSYGELGDAQIGPGPLLALDTIPRASQVSFGASAVDAGDPITINTNRASSSFTHTVKYSIGSASGTIATGVGASTSWTPPLSLLSQIPNATSGTVTITLDTYSGSTKIGTDTGTFTLRVPSTVVPDFTTITHSENVSAVATIVGAYVKGLSKLNLAITGAAGIYGSTIKSYSITLAGTSIAAASGVSQLLTTSGTVTITGKITDSRGRTKTKTVNVTVLNWAPPTVSGFSVIRSTAGGVADPNGTSLSVAFTSGVSTLVNGTQKNTLTHRISTREKGTTTWTVKSTVLAPGITANGPVVIATYAIDKSWEVKLEIIDKFATSAVSVIVPTASIFMHWDAALGMGLGKFREQGMLDVAGDVYAVKLRLTGTGDASPTSTGHAFQVGPDNSSNLTIDQNEILARNNGVASSLNLNTEGDAAVNIGSANSYVSITNFKKFWMIYHSAAVSIPSGTFTKLTNWSTVKDLRGNIAYSGGTFTVNTDGVYFVHAQARFVSVSPSNGQRTARLVFTGTEAANIEGLGIAATTGISGGAEVTQLKYMAAGDTVSFEVYQSQGAALNTIAGEQYTNFVIGLVQSYGQ